MPFRHSTETDECLNRLEACMEGDQKADAAMWGVLATQIDAEIRSVRSRLAALRHAHRVVERNRQQSRMFPLKLKERLAGRADASTHN